MSENRVEQLLRFAPISKADREYLEGELLSEIARAESDQRWSDCIRLKKRLSELRTGRKIAEPQKTPEQRELDDAIEKAEREGNWSEAIRLKRRRAGF